MVAKVFIGVDVSKKHLDIFAHPVNKSLRIENSQEGMGLLLSFLSDYKDCIGNIACESTGGYEALMIATLEGAGHRTWIIEPSRIKAFIASEGIRSKTDKGDARMIALFAAQKKQPYEAIKLTAEAKKLQSLNKRRIEIKRIIVMEKLRLEHELIAFCEKSIKKHIRYLEKEILAIDSEIEKILKKDGQLKQKVEIISSIPGVGKTSAAAILAELPELGLLERRQISALAGVAPFTRESGTYKGIARTYAGRCLARQALFMVALTATRHNKLLSAFYRSLIAKGKKGMVAVVAVMRRLIVIINAMVRDKREWRLV